MKSLIATAFLYSQSHATLEETSLMQGLVARRGQLTPDAKDARKDATTKLMETATKMMKNGATPDVLTFIESTITEVESNVLQAIVDEHNRDQALIYELHGRIVAAVDAMQECADSIREAQQEKEVLQNGHKMCRSGESLACARSRKCEDELEEKWRRVVIEEEEMRRIHGAIYDGWCLPGAAPPHPSLADPWNWHLSEHYEGDETSQSEHMYPEVELGPAVITFREFNVEYFRYYIEQLPRVEIAWEEYNAKLIECAAKEETWTLHVDECDALQDELNEKACAHAGEHRECVTEFGHAYQTHYDFYQQTVPVIQDLEYDRKREWETLHIVTCLLRTVYTHVIHSIDSGEPCPTTDSNPEQTAAEINYCHVVEESLTTNLTIIYPDPPVCIDCVPEYEHPPCSPEYLWETQGSFSAELQASHSASITAEGLGEYFTLISAFGWAGCAAPKACIPCEATTLTIDPAYDDNEMCKHNHEHLRPGQMDWDTFKCLSGDQCVRSEGRCNEVSNCADGSDELGCDTPWGVPAVLQSEECKDPFVGELQFRCADNTCTHIAGKCNGIDNCADGSDEVGCATTTHGVEIEAMTGFTATIETPALHDHLFYDREYTIDSLGSFTGHSMIKMANEDKHIRNSHIQMKLRLPRPMIIYVVKLDSTNLPWLAAEGWSHTMLQGISYHGVRETRHTDWSGELNEDYYEAGQVFQKTFPAGTVSLRGNNGGDGSFVMFVAHPGDAPTPPTDPGMPGHDTYIGCFTDNSDRDLGTMVGAWTNSATNTYELCRAECLSRGNLYMSLQWGGECFCADEYATADAYYQVDDSLCNVVREPCSPNSHNCGGTWHQAIYQIGSATHYLTVVSWPNQAWGEWDSASKGALEKCMPVEGIADREGTGRLFTSCCTEAGEGMSRDCGSTWDNNFATAESQCASQGGRLCTAEEAMAHVTRSQGCSVDGPSSASYANMNRLWTSTRCTPEWTLVLQYGDSAYQPTSTAFGTVSESQSQFAKLSDSAINALPGCDTTGYDYYMLTSETGTGSVGDRLFLRVRGSYNDLSATLGFTEYEQCTAATFEDCTWIAASGGSLGIDTYYPYATNDCSRWFTGYQNSILCYADQGSGGRCWAHGNTCSKGSHAIRSDVRMYKKTA